MATHGLLRFVDSPEARLGPTALPMACLSFPDGVPARLMLKVVVAATDYDVVFSPDNLRAYFETRFFQRMLRVTCMQTGMPLVHNVARKERPRCRPICTIIVV